MSIKRIDLKIPSYEDVFWLWRKRIETWFKSDFDITLVMEYRWVIPKDKKGRTLQKKKNGQSNK